MRTPYSVFLRSSLLLLVSANALAVDPHTLISQYRHTAWRTQDGVVSSPGAITQTTDGYIWMRMSRTLMRFDGVKFTPWVPPIGQSLPVNGISSLLGGRDGSLWIGTYGGLSRFKDGKLFNYTTTPHSPGISDIIEDHAGTIWVTRYKLNDGMGPLCRVTGTTLQCYGKKDGFPSAFGLGLTEDTTGNIWFACKMLCRWAPDSSSVYFEDQLKNPAGDGVQKVVAGPSGSVWASLGGTGPKLGVQYYSGGKWASYVVPGFNGASILSDTMYMDRNHSLWIGTESHGLYRIHDGFADHYGSTNGLSGDSVASIYEDKEGNLWVTTNGGVDMFRDLPVVTFSTSEKLIGSEAHSVLALRDGSVWVGNEGALDIVRAGRISAIAAGHGLPGQNVGAMFQDHTGQIWLGIDNTIMTYNLGRFSAIKKSDANYSGLLGTADGFAEDTQGKIWALTYINATNELHLLRIRGQRVEEDIRVDTTIRAFFVAADRDAGIWLGSKDGKFVHYQDGKAGPVLSFGDEEILVRDFWVDSDNAVWLATSKGLYGWKDGRIIVMNSRNGLPCSVLVSAIKDNDGSFWLYANCGVLRIPASDYETWLKNPEAAVSVKTFDAFDGSQAAYSDGQPDVAKSADGRLWFASGGKVQMIDPNRTHGNVIPPAVFVEEVIGDRKSYLASMGLRLPALTRDLEIDYTALSFSVPQKVRFRYKLEGRDAGWQEPGTRREAFYSDLRPGKYRFRVIACNNDGVWNEEGASLDFNIAPAWYQTNWFRVACAATFLLLLWLIYQLRLRQLRHEFSIGLEARVNERTRIARELHDTLLQSFHGLLLRFQTVYALLPSRPEEAKQSLGSVIDQAAQAITESRDAVQGLRSSTIESNDLAAAIRSFGEELLADETNRDPAVFHVQVEGTPRDLNPILRDEVYRIACEALRNAFRHAKARQIEAEIRYDGGHFGLRVRDDGKGIDPTVLGGDGRQGHYGLHGMRERAEVVGGKLTVWSDLNSGTEVELSIPAAAAYAASPPRSWLSEKFSGRETPTTRES
ncbi:MAG TPA: two-component regulator propeller domain-containing protein [Candidatus Aquilonibacter sp.]|nr:two-component regulator propeller domain-containing protein [Candidatus Aquilonibacter sp.]